MKRINSTKVGDFKFRPVQAGDNPIGQISEPAMQALCHLYMLEQHGVELAHVIDGEHDHTRRVRLMLSADELEYEISFVQGLYYGYMHMEKSLQSWTGAPIFTIREQRAVVIRERDLRDSTLRVDDRPFSRSETMIFYRKIALASITPQRP
ncbi:MAG: hypothetical protein JWO84_258 [Parcubacteria group bacterium]|nr:hypothetical protein [Parcubacteria group bacterium]